MSVTDPRLGYQVDTSGLERAVAAQDRLVASGVRLAQTTDNVSLKLSSVAQGGTQNLRSAADQLNAAAQALQRAKASLPANWEQMTQKQRTRWSFDEHMAGRDPLGNISRARADVAALEAAQKGANTALKDGAESFSLLGTAAGTFAGILAFQVVGAIGNVLSEIARLPMEAARAQDSLLRLNTQLTYAFHGSSTAARQAREDIIALSRETGLPYNALSQQYAGIATGGRAANLTRSEVTGLTEAFARIGLMTGADSGMTGRAQWQLMQALAIGRLNGMDWRQMRQNLPGLTDVVARGEGVSPGRLQAMVTRGEISAERLVRDITRGIEVLEASGTSIPHTMEMARGKMETEWELMLQDMGDALHASQLVQGMTDLVTEAIRAVRRQMGGEVSEGNAGQDRRSLAIMGMAAYPFLGPTAGLAATAIPAPTPGVGSAAGGAAGAIGATAAERAQVEADAAQLRDRARGNANDVVMMMDALAQQRGDYNAQIGTLRQAIGVGGSAEEVAAWTRSLSVLQAQLARVETSFQRARREMAQSFADFARYGAGAGFEMAGQARSMVEQSIAQGSPIGMDAAMAQVFRGRLLGARNETAMGTADLALARRLLLPAAGDPAAMRRAQVEYDVARFAQSFGPFANDNEAQQAISDRRGQLSGQQAFEQERANAERLADDRERLRVMREQLNLGVRLGQEGRIAAAQLEREQDLRRAGVELTAEQLRDERERVAQNVRISEQLSLQNEQLARLQDAAEAAGSTIGDVFGATISEGIHRGRITGEAALDALANHAERVLADLVSTVTAPLERRITDFVGRQLERRMGGSGGEDAIDALTAAATDAAKSLADQMKPSLTKAAVEMAVSTKATMTETLAKQASTSNLIIFSKSVMAATAALQAMAAQEGADKVAAFLPKFATGVKNFSGGWAVMNEMGGEIVKLPRGSTVYPHGQGPEAAPVSINIIDQRGAGAPVETRESRGPNGERMIEVMIRDEQRKNIRQGKLDTDMRAQYGAGRVLKKI